MRTCEYGYEDYEFVSSRGNEGLWFGHFPDLPGSQFTAGTRDELHQKSAVVFEEWITASAQLGLTAPEPGWSAAANGTIRIRTERSLHKMLADLAGAHGVSLSSLVTAMLYAGLELSDRSRDARSARVCSSPNIAPAFLYLPGRKSVGKTDRVISGTWVQRIPVELHQKLLWKAMAEDVSLNLLANNLLTRVETSFVIAEKEAPRLRAVRA